MTTSHLPPHVMRERRRVLGMTLKRLSRVTKRAETRLRLIELGAVEPSPIEQALINAALWVETETEKPAQVA